MKVGDQVLFYHSMIVPPKVVGISVVVKEAYPDNTAWDTESEHPDPKSSPDNPIWYMVDIKAQARMACSVSLNEIKAHPGLTEMVLVKLSRLSVQPVTETEWNYIVEMGHPEKIT